MAPLSIAPARNASPRGGTPASLSAILRADRVMTALLRVITMAFRIALTAIILSTSARAQTTTSPNALHPINTSPFATTVSEASRRFGIPAAWIRAVMQAESVSDVHATSPKGAMGLMQIMPKTWAELRRRYHLGADPYSPHDNIMAGAAYLRELYDRYGSPGFLAAYNAGPARWEEHLATGRPLPGETRRYLAKLVPTVRDGAGDDATLLASVARSWTKASLFPHHSTDAVARASDADRLHGASRSGASSAQDWTGLAPHSDGLFADVSSSAPSQ